MINKIAFTLLICLFALYALGQETPHKNIVKAYYAAFEKHDWKLIAGRFGKDFTFTSANNDNHIPLAKFREKCWPTNKFFKKVSLIKMTESGNSLYLLVEITTTESKIVRNVDLFNFSGGKIIAIETFFGRGQSYPGNKK